MDENKRTMKTRSMTAAKEDARKEDARKEAAIAQAEWDAQMDATNIPPPRKFYGYSDTCIGPGCIISGGKTRKRRKRRKTRKSRKMSRSRRRY